MMNLRFIVLVLSTLLPGAEAQLCAAGSFAANASACVPCAPGTFASSPSALICSPCPAGMFNQLSGAVACAPCSPNSYSLPGARACATCPLSSSAVITSSVGCLPTNPIFNGAFPQAGLAFVVSGSSGEGTAALGIKVGTGFVHTADVFGTAQAALTVSPGSYLMTPALSVIPATLPVAGAATIAAWVRCAPFASPAVSSVFEWGAPADTVTMTKLALMVAATGTPAACPGPFSACDATWHHLAVVQNDRVYSQFLDGALLGTAATPSMVIPTGASVRVGYNGFADSGPASSLSVDAVGTTTWTVPLATYSVSVLIVGGGGGGGGGAGSG